MALWRCSKMIGCADRVSRPTSTLMRPSDGCTDHLKRRDRVKQQQQQQQQQCSLMASLFDCGSSIKMRFIHMFSAEIFETSPWAQLMDSTDVPESHRQ